MAEHFLGSLISLVSTSDIRYRGILRQIDHVNSTIQLEQVFSMGTEHRRPAHEYLPPNPKPYDYIVFRATEVKDLNVERHAADLQTAMLNDDPAIIGASSGVQPPPSQAAAPQAQAPVAAAPVTSTTPAEPAPAPGPAAATVVPAAAATEPGKANGQQQPQQPRNVANVRQQQTQRQVSRDGSIRSAEVAVESVERAMDQLRVGEGDDEQPAPATNVAPQQQQQQPSTERRGGGGGRGRGRRGGHHGPAIKGPGVVPDTPFDFNRANAKFDKASLVLPEFANAGSPEAGAETPSTSEAGTPAPGSAGAAGAGSPQFYDKKKSFFDDISSDSKARAEEASTGVRVGGAAMARQRREEERNRNLSTFGETGIGGGAQHHWHGGGGRGGPGGRGRGGRRRGGGGGGRGGASSSAAAVSAQ